MSGTVRVGLLFLVFATSFAAIAPARAGCGCDHPAPPWTLISPSFASPGSNIRVHADGADFQVGASYRVEFGTAALVDVVAGDAGYLSVKVPAALGSAPGPKSIKVSGNGYLRTYGDALFTALPPAPRLPPGGGEFGISRHESAVAADGTLLLPLDVTDIRDAMQLSFIAVDRPLAFGVEDVVIYNADGVDLTLFTMSADDATERQWGSYFGWRVEGDKDLHGDVFEHKVNRLKSDRSSDVLSYWRHEFHSYTAAHDAGGSHAVDTDGRHPDGSLHIDHHRLVLAINALQRRNADDTEGVPLAPGAAKMDLVITVTPAAGPLEPGVFMDEVMDAVARFLGVQNKPARTLISLD